MGASRKRDADGLTLKQRAFVLAYVQVNNGAEAYRQAYETKAKPATCNDEAGKLLRLPTVAAAIAKLRAELQERAEVTVADIIRELWDNALKAKQAEPVRDKEGRETGEYRADFAASNAALKAIGDHLGAFDRRAQTEKPSALAKLSAEEQRALLEAVERERERRRALDAAPDEPFAGGVSSTLQ